MEHLDFKVQQHNSGDISDIDLEKAKLEYSKYEFSLKKIQISISDQEDLILDYMSTIPSTNKYPELMDRSLDLSSESLIEFAVNNNPSIKSRQI